MGGVNGMLTEMDRDATVARLAADKTHWRETRRVEGRWPYGEHPSHKFDAERAVVDRIEDLLASSTSSYAMARGLNAEGTRTRYGKEFTTTTVQNIAAGQAIQVASLSRRPSVPGERWAAGPWW